MQPDLGTTNVLLGIMAAVSVLEALVLIGMAIGGVMIYRRVMTVVADLETRQIAPVREKVDAILVDVKSVTARVNEQAARVDDAINGTVDRVDETTERVRHSVREKVNRAAGIARAVRAVIVSLLSSEPRTSER